MDPAAAAFGSLVAAAVLVGLVVLGLGLAYSAGKSGESRAGSAELGAAKLRLSIAEGLAAHRAELLEEAHELLEAQVRNDDEAQRRQSELDSIRHGDVEAGRDTPAGRAARLAAVDRLLRVARERRRPGRTPALPGPVPDAPTGDGRGATGVV